jgi:hypothetical protein
MRVLIAIALAALLSACATPYYPVYVNDSGDYYIAETESTNYYYTNFVTDGSLGYIGMYPWWEFSYYSPYFYPYHFAVWHPGSYYRHRGWYSGYYPYWCPPHRWSSWNDQPIVSKNTGSAPVDKHPSSPPIGFPAPPFDSVAQVQVAEERARGPDVVNGGSPVVLVRSPTVSGYARPPRSSMPANFSAQSGRQAYSSPQQGFSSRSGNTSSRAVRSSSRSSTAGASSRRVISRSNSNRRTLDQ